MSIVCLSLFFTVYRVFDVASVASVECNRLLLGVIWIGMYRYLRGVGF
jgi:hypothetical protein